jgi:AcrR family transcriptional regulator
MAVKKQAATVPGGRQAAYTARNRAALIKAGQQVLAEVGPQATIEQLVEYAEVSPTTIYKYFENKEALFAEAFNQSWESWIEWSNQVRLPGERLEMVLDTGRKFFWAKKHDPLFAKILHNTLQDRSLAIKAVSEEGKRVFKELAKSGAISNVHFEERWTLWSNILAGLLASVYVSEDLSPSQAEVAFGIGLSVWGISEAKASKIINRQLQFGPAS